MWIVVLIYVAACGYDLPKVHKGSNGSYDSISSGNFFQEWSQKSCPTTRYYPVGKEIIMKT